MTDGYESPTMAATGTDRTVRTMRRPLLGHHHWSDWVGFTVFSCAVLWGASSKSGVTVFGLPVLILQFLYALGYLLRGPAVRTLSGLGPRVTAYTTAYMVPAFLLAAGRWAPELTRPVASPALRMGGWILGSVALVFAIRPLWWLRHSFSVEPVARTLITTGPYSFARHPIYSSYLIAYLGLWISTPRLAVTVLLLAWFVMLRIRIRYEERVLGEAYPEYAAYRARVGMFGPRLKWL